MALCRRKIARLLFESQSELADSTAGRSGADISVVSSDDWSDYSSWSLQLRHQHASEEVTSAYWNRVQPALCIESVAACRDMKECNNRAPTTYSFRHFFISDLIERCTIHSEVGDIVKWLEVISITGHRNIATVKSAYQPMK